MQSYMMKKNHMNIKNSDIINFDRLLKFTIKNQHEKELVWQFHEEVISIIIFFILSQSQAMQNPTIVHNLNMNVSVDANIAWS